MKTVIATIVLLLPIISLANITLDIDLMYNDKNSSTAFKTRENAVLDEVKTVNIPNSNLVLEIRPSEAPTSKKEINKNKDQIFLDVRLIESQKDQKKMLTSRQALTIFGTEMLLETYEDDKQKNKVMTLKIIPNKR